MRLVLENAGLSVWPALSLLIFFATTLGMLAWIYRPGSSEFYKRLGRMALEDQRNDVNRGARDAAPVTQNFPEA